MKRKTAFITGASRGIGKACAKAFAAAGYDLYITCQRSENELRALARQLAETCHISASAFIGDIGDPDFVETAFREIPALDVLINNAGIAYFGLLSDMPIADWQRVINTNLNSAFYTSRLAIPLMLSAKSGRIINISSVWGNVGASMETAYSASKGGLNSLTKALAKELAPSGISVNAIACGVIDTDMNHNLSHGERENLREGIPADRFGRPEEAAALALQLAEAPSYLTGQIIALDGGFT